MNLEWIISPLITLLVAIIAAIPVYRKISRELALLQAQIENEEVSSTKELSATAMQMMREIKLAREADQAESVKRIARLTNQIEIWRESAIATQAELETLRRKVDRNEAESAERYQILEEENRLLQKRVRELSEELEKYRQINERLRVENEKLNAKLRDNQG